MSKEYTADTVPMLDIGLAFDHEKRTYQIQLYGSNIETTDTVIAILPPQRLEYVIRELQRYHMMGYMADMSGVRLPCEAEKMMEKWK